MARIPEDTIRKILEATDIVALIGSYIPLKKAGTIYKGCCPFHNEKTPSFTVSASRQSFKCFGCGEGGSAIGFVMKYENLSFGDTVRKLADKAAIFVEEEAYDPRADRERKRRLRLIDLHKAAAEWYHRQLMTAAAACHARDYLKGRGYGSDMAKNWQVGWAPGDSAAFLAWAKGKGFTGRELLDSGLCFLKQENNPRSGLMCRFRDRLMFPISNDYGEIVAFSGRILEAKANTGKYINSPETALFRKGNVVFALNRARRGIAKQQTALICEGQLDVIACHEAGVVHAVAPLGTAFTSSHARLMRRYTTRVTLCFDGDSAGMKAADRAFRELAPEGLYIDLASLPAGDDPDSFLKREGAEGFRQFLAGARPFFEARLQRAQAEGVLSDPSRRSEFIGDLSALIALIPDKVYQDGVITDVATLLRIGLPDLRKEVKNAAGSIAEQKKRESERSVSFARASRENPAPYDDASYTGEEPSETWQQDTSAPLPLPPPRLIALDRPVYQLCELCLQFSSIQHILLQRIEDIVEPLEHLRGGHLLRRILSSQPNPDNPSEIQAFLESLPPSEAFTLRRMECSNPQPNDPEAIVLELISALSQLSLQKQRDSVIASLMKPDLSAEEKQRLLDRLKALGELLP